MTGRPRRFAPLLIALVVAVGLLGAPGSPVSLAPVRAATPDLTIVSDARYDVQPAQKRVRVTVSLHLTNHLKDTTTKRFYFDQAFLAVLPGASAFKLTGGTGTPSRIRLQAVRQRDDPAPDPRIEAVQREVRHVHAPVRPRGQRRSDDSRPAYRRLACVVPGLGVRNGRDPRQHRHRRLPGRLRDERRSGQDPGPDHGLDRAHRLPGRSAGYAADLLRVPRRRSARCLFGTIAFDDRAGRHGATDDPGLDGRPRLGEAGRQPGQEGPADVGRRHRARLAARRHARRAGGGQPVDRWLRRPVRSDPGPRRGRLLRGRRGRPARGGARLVQRLAARRSLGQRGVRLVLRGPGGQGPQGPRHRQRVDRNAPQVGHPAQRLGSGRQGVDRRRGLRVRRDPGARRRHRRTRRSGRASGGVGRCRRSSRRLPATRTSGNGRGRDRGETDAARDRRRPARLAGAAGPARGGYVGDVRRPLADLGGSPRGSSPADPARDGSDRIREGARGRRSVGPAQGRPRGDARVAVRRRDDPARPGGPGPDAAGLHPGGRGSCRARHARHPAGRVPGRRRLRRRVRRGDRRDRRDRALPGSRGRSSCRPGSRRCRSASGVPPRKPRWRRPRWHSRPATSTPR